MGITIKDIAKRANVSIATVSRVINKKNEGVGTETRKRILKIMKELNYYPNRIARGLVTKKTNILGLVLPDIANPFFPTVVRGIEDTASKYGYNIILCNSDNSQKKEETYINILKENNVDGIIYTSVFMKKDKSIEALLKSNIPFVLLDRSLSSCDAPIVYTDGISGMYKIVSYLIQNGHNKIAYISGPHYNSTAEQRLIGFKKALTEAGLSVDDTLIKEGDYKIESGYNLTLELLESGSQFSAIACANDLMAVGVFEALKEKNISIPEDISVTGFDDIYIAGLTSPKLTTMAQPKYEMGCIVAELLIKLVNQEEISDMEIMLETDLVVRKSVAKKE